MHIPIKNAWQLNERHYGSLTGLDKQETVDKHGKDQVHTYYMYILLFIVNTYVHQQFLVCFVLVLFGCDGFRLFVPNTFGHGDALLLSCGA